MGHRPRHVHRARRPERRRQGPHADGHFHGAGLKAELGFFGHGTRKDVMRTRKNGLGLGVALQAALFCFGFTSTALAQDEPTTPTPASADDAAKPAETTAAT